MFLVPMWKETLDFDMQVRAPARPSSRSWQAGPGAIRPAGSSASRTRAWIQLVRQPYVPGELYGFGRLAWNPDLTSKEIIDEWTRLTFGSDPSSRRSTPSSCSHGGCSRTTPVPSVQTLTDIVGNHFGVSVEASERNGWGQWHRADEKGVGMDRTVTTGTGFIGQHFPGDHEAL